LRYCLDTGVFIRAWRESYPPDVFPTFWTTFEQFIEDGEVGSPQVVLEELSKKDDELHKWAKATKGLFQPLKEDIQTAVSEILQKFPRMMEEGRDRNTADPFVVAMAKARGLTVVTTERSGSKKPKIPDVCQHFGIPSLGLVGLLRELKWTF
jgi:predicted nucleic acid-binding protein